MNVGAELAQVVEQAIAALAFSGQAQRRITHTLSAPALAVMSHTPGASALAVV